MRDGPGNKFRNWVWSGLIFLLLDTFGILGRLVLCVEEGRFVTNGQRSREDTSANSKARQDTVDKRFLRERLNNGFLVAVFANRARGRATASLRVTRRVARLIAKGGSFRVVGKFRGLQTNVLRYRTRHVASNRRRKSFVKICKVRLAVMGGRTCVTNVATDREALLRALRRAFRSNQRRAYVSNATRRKISGRGLATPLRERFFLTSNVSTVFLAIRAMGFQVKRAFVVKFCGRIGLARLANAAKLLLVAVINANDLNGNLTVEGTKLFGLGYCLFIILRSPLRDARIRLSLAICRGLARFLTLLRRPYKIFLARAIRNVRRLLNLDLVRDLRNANRLEVQVFSRIRTIFHVLIVRNISYLRVLRLRYAAGIANGRFLGFSAINSNAGRRLERTFLKAAINVTRVVAFIRLATRRLRMLRLAGVQFGDDLRRVR